MNKSSEGLDSALAAFLKGLNDSSDNLFWLKRAKRLAPDDPRIELEIARREFSLNSQGTKRSYQTFLSLAKQYDIAPAWIGIAICAQMLGDANAAAAALDTMLCRHCVPEDKSFPAFARHVALAAGYAGYQGYTANGVIVSEGQGRLLGSQPDLTAITRLEGVAEWGRGCISGWAVRPAWPDHPPRLTVTDSAGRSCTINCGQPLPVDATTPFLPRYKFRIKQGIIKDFLPPLKISGPNGMELKGSPLDPRLLQSPPVRASSRGTPPSMRPDQAPLILIMPIYRGFVETKAAIDSVLRAKTADMRFIVVNDASPETALVDWLEALHGNKKIELHHHSKNLGFCAAINTGLALAKDCDVLLLNSDILLPPKAIETLRQTAYAHAATGTVTPLSNEATICSYPDPNGANPMPDLAATTQLNNMARKTNGLATIEIPTGVGFCFYIRHDCLALTGNFRTELFAQGYGEENDFCMRARHLGFTHVAAMGVYVAHKGGVSFQSATKALGDRNIKILNKLYPGYQRMVLSHLRQDPAAPYRAALDRARLLRDGKARQSVLLISHGHGGGVGKQVDRTVSELRLRGFNPLLLTTKPPRTPKLMPYPWPSLLCTGNPKDYPNLTFSLPRDLSSLLTVLKQLKTKRIELHHMLGQHESLRSIAGALGVPQDIIAHDYASFCPRVNLLTKSDIRAPLRYCGEPDIAGCIKCCERDEDSIFEPLPVQQLLERSSSEFFAAHRIVVPSADMARRLARHFPGLVPQVSTWEDDSAPVSLRKPGSGRRRIAVIGGIGPAKGFDVILDCAQDARRRSLPIEFVVIGSSSDDSSLLEAGIMVTGPYKAEELPELIADLNPDLAFVPSICPETWCFVLTEAWNAGLHTIVFDLGAQAERVRATRRGVVLPLGLPSERINNALLSITF